MSAENDHGHFMRMALEEARQALKRGEFPVGCVLVHENHVLVTGSRRGTSCGGKNETDHAEMTALRGLDLQYPDTDRRQITLYCTMEPCLMCYGAILISGIGKIVYAYEDVMGGGTACDLSRLPPLYRESRISVVSGILRKESLDLFRAFFADPENEYWRESLLSRYTLAEGNSRIIGSDPLPINHSA